MIIPPIPDAAMYFTDISMKKSDIILDLCQWHGLENRIGYYYSIY